MAYLRELEDEAIEFNDLASNLDQQLCRLDVSVFAAIVGACQKGTNGKEHVKRIQARARFGCGRQAFRVLDEQHKHQVSYLPTEANSKIQELKCSGLEDLSEFMADFQLYKHQMGTGEHKLSNATGI